jgi:hypothetical protein
MTNKSNPTPAACRRGTNRLARAAHDHRAGTQARLCRRHVTHVRPWRKHVFKMKMKSSRLSGTENHVRS